MSDSGKLGTFLGVFTPSILTILGVILYLRTGWVVGNAGLFPALGIVILANIITLATALSVSAVSTNMRVGAGGAYYIISRSLGLEFGSAIGIPLFLAQSLSTTLYAFGLAESLTIVWPDVPVQLVAAGTIVAVGLLSTKGASIALKLQVPIMAAVGLSILSLFLGADFENREPVLWGNYADSGGFWDVFAVFFPAVTGIMAGVSMSGDLKNPKRSIPIGSVSAVLVGFVVYLSVPVLLAFNADADSLLSDTLIWTRIAVFPVLIFPGLWGAILSSAIGSSLGAPRTLQALAEESLVAFGEVNVVEAFEAGVFNVVQANGMGGLTSNTIMFGWTDYPDRLATYFRLMAKLERLKRSFIICRIAPRATFERTKQIDIWWRGEQHNGDLMLLLAHLLSLNPEWRDGSIIVKSIATSDHSRENLQASLDELLPRTRIRAESKVIVKPQDKSVKEVMLAESREAEVVFMGLMKPKSGEEADYAQRVADLVEGFPSVVLVRNGGWFVGELLEN